MRFYNFLFLIFLPVSFFQLCAQEIFLTQELDLKQSSYVIHDVLPVVNEKNGDIALFYDETKTIYAYLFNKNGINIGKFYTEEIPRKYKVILGYSIVDSGVYIIYSTNQNRTKFLTTTFDFKNKNAVSKEHEIDLEDEIFLQALNKESDFSILTINKKNSNISFYNFQQDEEWLKKELDLSNLKILNDKDKSTSVYETLKNNSFEILSENGLLGGGAKYSNLSFEKIDNNLPNPIEIVSQENKLFIKEDELNFTFDENKDITQVISINTNDYSWQFDSFDKPLRSTPKNQKKTNSFLFDTYLLNLASNDYGLEFRILDISSKEVIQKYSVLKDEEIEFNNTPIMLEGSIFKRYRELDETKKLIRKINRANVGISLYPTVRGYEISVGGHKEIKQGMPMVSAATSGLSDISPSNSFNTTFNSYAYFEGNKSIYTTGLFNEKFEHVEGNLQPTPFDRISDFKESRRKKPSNETIFKYDESLLWGEYDSLTNTYKLWQFSNEGQAKDY